MPINLAVITGGKSFDVIDFSNLFHNLAGISSYIQHIDDFASSPEKIRDSYDAVLFYLMAESMPVDEGLPGYCGKPKTALEHLGKTGQGLIVLHHALLAFPGWPVWDRITGITDRRLNGYKHDQSLAVKVADTDHPVTKDLSDWILTDETYDMADARSDSRVLLGTSREDNMRTVAWTRFYKNSRVFCLQLGHDRQAWKNENFKKILVQGIMWCGGK